MDFAWLIVVLGGKRWSQFLSFFLVSRNIWATYVQNLGGPQNIHGAFFQIQIEHHEKMKDPNSFVRSVFKSIPDTGGSSCFSKVHLQMKFVPICLQGLKTPHNTIFLWFLLVRKKNTRACKVRLVDNNSRFDVEVWSCCKQSQSQKVSSKSRFNM